MQPGVAANELDVAPQAPRVHPDIQWTTAGGLLPGRYGHVGRRGPGDPVAALAPQPEAGHATARVQAVDHSRQGLGQRQPIAPGRQGAEIELAGVEPPAVVAAAGVPVARHGRPGGRRVALALGSGPVGTARIALEPGLPTRLFTQPLAAGRHPVEHDGRGCRLVTVRLGLGQRQQGGIDIEAHVGQATGVPAAPQARLAAGGLQAQGVAIAQHLGKAQQAVELHLRLQGRTEVAQPRGPGDQFHHRPNGLLALTLYQHLALQVSATRVAGHDQPGRLEHGTRALAMQHQIGLLDPGTLAKQHADPEVEAIEVEGGLGNQFGGKLRRGWPVPASRWILIEMHGHALQPGVGHQGHAGSQAGEAVQAQLGLLHLEQGDVPQPLLRANLQAIDRQMRIKMPQACRHCVQLHHRIEAGREQAFQLRCLLLEQHRQQAQHQGQHRQQRQDQRQQRQQPARDQANRGHGLTSARCRTAPGSSGSPPGSGSACR